MILRRWKGFCLAAEEEALFPQGAEMCGEVFAPLVFLVRRDPLRARGLYPIRDLSELDEPEGIGCLTPSSPAEGELAAFVRAHGAGVLNAAFSRAFSILQAWSAAKKDGLVLTLVGLGDVGGTALLALKLLGRELAKVQIFDPNRAQCQRYEMELNQVLSADGRTLPEVVICEEQDLFRCDLFAFTASRGVPGLDSKVQDVRMAQYEANRAMVGSYARMARQADFTGLFCQISDPVDHLSRSVFLQSNQKETGEFDFAGLLPEQVQGFGLGVMAARCAYYARRLGLDEDALRASPIRFGLVTVEKRGLKPRELPLEEIPKGKVKDYLLASAACFPALRAKQIDGVQFLDGGYRDNMPTGLAQKMGAEELVCVDLEGVGITLPNRTGLPTTMVRSYWELGDILHFDPDTARRNIELGYYDTLRAFGRLRGCAYAVAKNEQTAQDAAAFRQRFDAVQKAVKAKYPVTLTADLALKLANMQDAELAPLEAAAEDVGVDPTRYYTVETLAKAFLETCDRTRIDGFEPLFEGSGNAAQAAWAALLPNTFLQALVFRTLTASASTEVTEE